MAEEPWDEGVRPPPPRGDPPAAPVNPVRSSPRGVPPAAAFTRSSSVGHPTTAFNASGSAVNFARTNSVGDGSVGGGSFADEDMMEENEDDYDGCRIRQEALRMLEVAEAGDSHYSVHRTITGGFTAQPRTLGPQKGRAALSGLNYVATRKNVGKRYSDFAVSAAEDTSMARDDYEYGEDSVVDVIGLEKRSAESEAPSANNWSSRYSIDSTRIAMSGGVMKSNKSDHTRAERLSALNLFSHSPTKKTQVFGSGFSFRQNHVFGKQNVTMPTNNLQSLHQGPLTPNTGVKTWQEQIALKKRRRWIIIASIVFLCAVVIPISSIYGVKSAHNKSLPADGDKGSVTFFVTANGPYNDEQTAKLQQQLQNVADSTAFSVHLGNLQDPKAAECDLSRNDQVAKLLSSSSPKPVFVVPGEEDWNNCAEPKAAWDDWVDKFEYFHQHWAKNDDDDLLVYFQRDQRSNWAFLRDSVLFLGVSAVNGIVPDQAEFDTRNNYNFRWVKGMAKDHEASIRAIVIFGNAKPGFSQNIQFFAQLEDFWRSGYGKPVLYVHASPADGKLITPYKPFKDIQHFYAAQVDTSKDIGIRINVGEGPMPFLFG